MTLALRRHAARGPRRAVALCTHAMMAHGGYFAKFAEALAERGVEVFVLDFRGHGASKPPRVGRDDWCFDDYVRRDLPAAVRAVADVTGVTAEEIVYVGHSLGGLVGLAGFGSGEAPAPRRLVLVAVNVWTRLREPKRLAVAAGFAAVALLGGRMPARALRIGSEDEPLGYVRQFTRWVRSGWRSRDGLDYAAGLGGLRADVLALVGEGDWLCREEDTRALVGRCGGHVRVRAVGRGHGDAIDPDHFRLVTDERLSNLWQEVAEFCVGGGRERSGAR